MRDAPAPRSDASFLAKPGAWVDLALTLPLFLTYQLGVVFLNLRNGTDLLTAPLMQLAEGNRGVYLLLTSCIGVAFAGVFALLGRGQAFRITKFVQIAVEGVVYAVVMRIAASYVVGNIFAGRPTDEGGPFGGVVQSCGAGFYEELAFRVVLFGLGAKLLIAWLGHEKLSVVATGAPRLSMRSMIVMLVWSAIAAAVFSGAHYVGSVSDQFRLTTFTFRWVLGVLLSLIYVTRGFAAAVWAHTVYDVWVIVF
jgi:hypothetical protein